MVDLVIGPKGIRQMTSKEAKVRWLQGGECWGWLLLKRCLTPALGLYLPPQPTCLAEFKHIKSIKCSSVEDGRAVLQLGLSSTPQVRQLWEEVLRVG